MNELHTPIKPCKLSLVQHWPMPSQSAEAMLVRQEVDHVLYTHALHHQTYTALTVCTPLDTPNSTPAMAIRAGNARHMETWDGGGIAVTRPISGTTWYVEAKSNHDEVLAPLRRLTLW